MAEYPSGTPTRPDSRSSAAPAPWRGRPDITTTDEWAALAEHHDEIGDLHLRELFADDPDRGHALTAYGRRPRTSTTQEPGHRRDDRRCSSRWRDEVGLTERIAAMFAGEHINTSEDRAVLHTALRLPRERARSSSTARTSSPTCTRVLDKMGAFADRSAPASGRATPASAIATVVNIGIGGSDLGPVMAYEALEAYLDTRRRRCRFVSNIDPTDVYDEARTTSTRPRRCSSSCRRRSPRWRR